MLGVDEGATGLYSLYVHIAATDARQSFRKLLDKVVAGEVVTITRHGEPIAQLRKHPDAGKNNWPNSIPGRPGQDPNGAP